MGKMLVRVLAVFLVSTILYQTSAQDDGGQGHFDLMVRNVKIIAEQLAHIYTTCGPQDCCSQDICQPLLHDSDPFCASKQVNSSNLYNCSASLGPNSCPSIKVTTNRSSVSYVRAGDWNPSTPATGDEKNAICRTQQLDQVFKSISGETRSYTEYYVGMVDGSRRSFPGREEGGSDCLAYDSRKRPWYNGAISHPNHLLILIDCGRNMADDPSIKTLESRLDVAVDFALSLIETVYQDNYVNVFSFGAENDDTFASSTLVRFDNENPAIHTELEPLRNKIESLNTSTSNTSPSQFATAITTSLKAFSDKNISGLLNVIIFTDGSFTTGTFSSDPSVTEALDQVKSNNVHLFIYGINSGGSGAGLVSLTKAVNGIYKELQDSTNPLLSMQSYFGYLALSHHNLYGDEPFWGPNYKDYFNIGFISTVVLPAAIDIVLIDLPDDLQGSFNKAVETQRNKQDAISKTAGNGTTPPTFQNDDSLCQYNEICSAPSVNGDVSARKCCNSCEGPPKHTRTWVILVPVLIAVAVVGAIVSLCYWRKRRVREPGTRPVASFPPPQDQPFWGNPAS